MRSFFRHVLASSIAVLALLAAPAHGQQLQATPPLAPQPESPSGFVAKRAVVATRHMVAAANPLAAAAGRDILRQGGSALDEIGRAHV